MHNAGKYMAQGLINGIKEMWPQLFQAGIDAANQVIDGAKSPKGSDENSPSKKFNTIGRFMAEGLAIGINDNAYMASDAAVKMASNLVGTTGATLSNLSAILASNIDDTPVIRPVVDLSGARLAAGSVAGMFGDQEIAVIPP